MTCAILLQYLTTHTSKPKIDVSATSSRQNCWRFGHMRSGTEASRYPFCVADKAPTLVLSLSANISARRFVQICSTVVNHWLVSSSSFRNRSLLGPLPCQPVGYCAICSLLRLTVRVFSTCTSVSNCYQGLVRRSVACPGHALARLWCHDHLFQLVFHESALGAFGMSLIVCLSWTCSFSMSMVSRSLAFIFSYIGSFFRLQNTFQKLYHQLSTHVRLW